MSTTMRVMFSAFFSLAMDSIVKATRALVFIMVARYLGPVDSGAFTIALSYQAIFQAFTLAGTDYLLIREVARDNGVAADYFVHIAALKSALSVVSWAALLVFLMLLGTTFHYSPNTNRVILLLSLAILPEGLGEVCRALFVAFERLLFPTIVAVVVSTAKLGTVYLLLHQGAGVETVALVVVIASGLSVAANLVFIFGRLVKPVWTLRYDFFRTLLPNLSNFAGMGILRILEYHITILVLSYISGEQQVGIYNAAYTLVLAVLMASQAYGSGFMPLLSRLHAESQYTRLTLVYRRSVQLILVIGLPIVIALIWFSSTLVLSVYTPRYEETIPVLQVLSPVILFTLFFAPHMCIMLAANLQKWVVRILLVSIVTNVLAGVLLIPRYGAIGASVARVVATGIAAILCYMVVYVKVVHVRLLQLVGFPVLAGAVMVGAAWALRHTRPWVALLSSGAAYLVTLVLPAVLSRKHRRLALQMIGCSRPSHGA